VSPLSVVHETRHSTHRSLALCLLLLTGGCDKLALREHVALPEDVQLGGPPGNQGNSDGGSDGFRPPPSGDAGSDGESDGGTGGPHCEAPSTANVAFSKQALIENFGQCALAQYCLFDSLVPKLVSTTAAYAESPNETTALEAQTAWYYAMQQWQVAELMRFGPTAPVMEPAGQGMRDNLVAFPNANRCETDERLEDQSFLSGDFTSFASGARGLGTMEYLLFFGGSSNGCSKFSLLNYPAPGKWAALSADVIAERKRAYARAAAEDIAKTSKALLDAWNPPSSDGFAAQFFSAGKGSKLFPSEQTALNAVSHALYYMDKEVKDWKIARPAGLGECTQNCATTAESLYAKTGSDNLRANLRGFRLLFEGCGDNFTGLGFDDWLRNVGAGDVADRMLAAIANAESAMANFDIDKAFVQDPASVDNVRKAFKAITDILKTDMMTVLNLERPMALEGDND